MKTGNAMVQISADVTTLEDLEQFKGETFRTSAQAVETINKALTGAEDSDDPEVFIYSLTDFVDVANNDEFDVDNSWLT